MRAERGDAVGAAGQVAQATVEESHAILAPRGEWVLNEKRIVERAGLARMHALLSEIPPAADDLFAWANRAARALRPE